MKSDKLLDAIGMVDTELVHRAETAVHRKTRLRRLRVTSSVAAVLAVVIGLGVFFGTDNSALLSTRAITEAEYPEMAQYPVLGGLDEEGYDAWWQDKREQREYAGTSENLSSFYDSLMAELLTSGDNNENKVCSPVNIYLALSMLAEISDGNTRRQILHTLSADSIESLRTQAHSVWNLNYCDDGLTKSILASSVWLNEGVHYEKATLDILRDNYYASAYSGKMGSKDMNKAYANWLDKNTGGMLRDKISDNNFNSDDVLGLATTVYYQAQWSRPFAKSATTNGIFHSPSGDVRCEFMCETENPGAYCWGEKFSSVRRGIQGSGDMFFILPDEGVSTDELLRDEEMYRFIKSDIYDEWEKTAYLKVNMKIPKFDISSKAELSDSIKALGITDCFSPYVDFSPLLGENQQAAVSGVNHGVRLKIDEEGVTGAAYTDLKLYGAGAPEEDEIDFILDRPFLVFVVGADSTPLFAGVVNNP